MEKINLEGVTIVSVACVRVSETLKAIKKSISGINFAEVKLLTSQDVECEYIEIIKIPELDYEGYNKFIVYELYKYIDTDFVLIVQDDGYVINPHLWQDKFLNYDYIGAVWDSPKDSFSCRDPFGNIVRVGNGGFSLRSKKLIRLPSELGLPWKSYYGYYNEDGFFCAHNRHIFENHGCKWSPIEVAKYFSQEADLPEVNDVEPFGFHGRWSKYFTTN